MNALLSGTALLAADIEKAPPAKDTVAGWTAFIIFLLLIAGVAVIGVFVTRSLKIAQRAKEQGLYGDEPVGPDADADTDAGHESK